MVRENKFTKKKEMKRWFAKYVHIFFKSLIIWG